MTITPADMISQAMRNAHEESTKIWIAAGEGCLKKQNYTLAEVMFSNAARTYSQTFQTDVALKLTLFKKQAFTYGSLGQDDKATALCESTVADIESNPAATLQQKAFSNYFLGMDYLQGEQFEKAVNVLYKALGFTPYESALYERLGKVYTEMKDYESALSSFNHAVNLEGNPLNKAVMIRESLGRFFVERHQYDEAIKAYEEALQLPYDNFFLKEELCRNLGDVYLKIERYDEAVASFTEALHYNSLVTIAPLERRAQLFSILGDIYLKSERREDAFEAFEMSLKLYKELDAKWIIGRLQAKLESLRNH